MLCGLQNGRNERAEAGRGGGKPEAGKVRTSSGRNPPPLFLHPPSSPEETSRSLDRKTMEDGKPPNKSAAEISSIKTPNQIETTTTTATTTTATTAIKMQIETWLNVSNGESGIGCFHLELRLNSLEECPRID